MIKTQQFAKMPSYYIHLAHMGSFGALTLLAGQQRGDAAYNNTLQFSFGDPAQPE